MSKSSKINRENLTNGFFSSHLSINTRLSRDRETKDAWSDPTGGILTLSDPKLIGSHLLSYSPLVLLSSHVLDKGKFYISVKVPPPARLSTLPETALPTSLHVLYNVEEQERRKWDGER